MIRRALAARGPAQDEYFRWRGGEVTRIEGLTDAVFGFAITLLVVSLEVPPSFDRLKQAMGGVLGFAISFVLLISVWHEHYQFFRRYGLQDKTTTYLNYFLLFVILVYVYPLKFLFAVLAAFYTGHGFDSGVIRPEQMPQLMVIFSLGFTAVNAVFLLLNLHAYRRRADLELDEVELVTNREGIVGNLAQVGVGLTSIVIATVLHSGLFAGLIYMMMAPLMAFMGARFGKQRRIVAERVASAAQPR
jgi:uncharacterized membrane protein